MAEMKAEIGLRMTGNGVGIFGRITDAANIVESTVGTRNRPRE